VLAEALSAVHHWPLLPAHRRASVAGFHAILPNMDMLHRLIVAYLTSRKDKHGNIWSRRPPGVSKAAWNPPQAGLEDKT
jgi:hypothetical protein